MSSNIPFRLIDEVSVYIRIPKYCSLEAIEDGFDPPKIV